jgi:hypothetical protein
MEGGNLVYSTWTKKTLAEKLELPQTLQQLDIIDKALDVLKSSPLLKGTFPRLPKRSPRKREDYKCGTCGKKKRNHVCSTDSQNSRQAFQEDDDVDDDREEDDDYVNDDDREDGEMGLHASKKRKKTFKPLVVVMHDNHNTAVQSFLYQVKMIGEKNVEPKLSIAAVGENDYNIFGHIVIPQISSIMCVGKISDTYKEIVRKSMEDQSLIKIELQPLQQMGSNTPIPIWLVQFVLHRNSSWRTKKLIELESINKGDE